MIVLIGAPFIERKEKREEVRFPASGRLSLLFAIAVASTFIL
jgi:hypothetical protein